MSDSSTLKISGSESNIILNDTSDFDLLNAKIIISDGAILTFSDHETNFLSSRKSRGFQLKSGEIELTNGGLNISGLDLVMSDNFVLRVLDSGSMVNMTEGASLTVNNGKVVVQNGGYFGISESQLNISADSELIIDDALFEASDAGLQVDSSNVKISFYSAFSFSNSDFQLIDSSLDLNRNSAYFYNGSLFKTSGSNMITGHIPATDARSISVSGISYLYDPVLPVKPLLSPDYVLGDRIVIDNSIIDLSAGTQIRSGSGTLWDGIYIVNSGDSVTANQIRGDIQKIQYLGIYKSHVNFSDVEISNCFGLHITSQSTINMSDLSFHDNRFGINVYGSLISINDSEIFSNNKTGLKFGYSAYTHNLKNVLIHDNNGSGIDIAGGIAVMDSVFIYDNAEFGFVSLSELSSSFSNRSTIANNKLAELSALGIGFPIFFSGNNTIKDDVISTEHATDLFLLMALGDFPYPIIIIEVNIDTRNPNRFYPSISAFDIYPQRVNIDQVRYERIIGYMLNNDYQTAIDSTKVMIQDIDTDPAYIHNGLLLLMNLYNEKDGNFDDFLSYIDYFAQIPNSFVYLSKKHQILASLEVYKQNYQTAIELYQEIIENPPDELSMLLAELHQAYCHYQANITNPNFSSVRSRHTPTTYQDYVEIQDNIYAKIMNLNGAGSGDTIPEIKQYSVHNYPNPFNPTTTIEFRIPKFSGSESNSFSGVNSRGDNLQKVSIEIFNIKGQKVRSLVKDNFAPGIHRAIWNGKDDIGKNVGSGVYLYRIQAGDYSATKKMLLMK